MKSTLMILCLFATLGLKAMPDAQADQLVAQGQRAYAAGDHQAALNAFDSVAIQFNSAALQLNIGNCWFKMGDVAHAILHYERGLRLAPGDVDLQANLDLANEQVKDRIAAPPAFALGTTWERIRSGNDPDQWARRSLWAVSAFFALLAAAVVVRAANVRRALWALCAGAVFWMCLCIAFAAVRHTEVRDDSEAIIMAAKVDVRGEPREASTVLFVLHKGTKVTVLQESQGWCEVQLPNGNVGWMPPASVERI